MTTRRNFIGGAAAVVASAPLGAWAAKPSVPHLTFGVLSEITVRDKYPENQEKLENVLRFFRQKQVDAVAFLGDIMYSGQIHELAKFAESWDKIFPGGRGKGGSKVELLAVTGDHDAFGWTGRWDKIPKERQETLRFNYGENAAKTWKRLFNQEWEVVWKREVKGYTFIGGQDAQFNPRLEAFISKVAPTLNKNKPFFVLSHKFPEVPGCGFEYLGKGSEPLTRALSPFSNAVSINAHSHIALTNERAVWQGDFTSISAGSLLASVAEFSYENMSSVWHPSSKKHVMDIDNNVKDQGGALLVQVYDDHLNVQRLHVPSECKQLLGPTWKIPLPAQPGGAFDHDKRRAARRPPQFAATAKLGVEFCPDGHPSLGPSFKCNPCYCVTIPFAKTVKSQRSGESCRVFDYVVTAKTAGKDPVVRKVVAEGATLPESMSNVPTKCLFLASELAEGQQIKFSVVPRDCFGLEGKPLTKTYLPQVGADAAKGK